MQIVDNDPERNDTAKALQWYERGIKANPAAPDCYIEYAKTLLEHRDTVNSLNKMKEINGVVPSYPANLAMARICKKVYKYSFRVFKFVITIFVKNIIICKHFKRHCLQFSKLIPFIYETLGFRP